MTLETFGVIGHHVLEQGFVFEKLNQQRVTRWAKTAPRLEKKPRIQNAGGVRWEATTTNR